MVDQVYKVNTGTAYEGQIAYASEPRVVISGNAEEVINYGLALKTGVGAHGVLLGSSTGNVLGVAIRELNHEATYRPSDGTTAYKVDQTVSVMREGTINVLVTVRSVAKYNKLNIVNATGAFTGGSPVAGETASVNVVALETGLVGEVIKARIDIVA